MKTTLNPNSERLVRYIASLFRPPQKMTVAEWACKNVRFNEPDNQNNYSLRCREYIEEPLNLMANNRVTDIVLVFGSQSGKTAMLMAAVSWLAVNQGCRILWVMPGQDLAENFSSTRLIPMFKASPAMAAMLPSDPRKTTKAQQQLGGSIINLVGSNSGAKLSSTPARIIIMDEVDKFPIGIKAEADALNLAEQRTKTFPNPKRIKTSTPTIEPGLIWQEYLKGSQNRYEVPCPHCGQYLVFGWSPDYYTLPKLGNEAYVYWDKDAKIGDTWNYEKVKKSAHAECPFCKGHILDVHKTVMIRKGRWRVTNPNTDSSFVSYHLSSLYSNDTANNFGNLAVKFLKMLKSAQGVQGFVNGDLGEPWLCQEAVNRTEIIVSASVPTGNEDILFLTADYQQKAPYIWYVVRAWSPNGDSRLVDFGSLNTFEEFEEVQKKHDIPDTRVVVDSGYDSLFIYELCAQHGFFTRSRPPSHIGWIPSKGQAGDKYWLDPKSKQKICFGFGAANLPHRQFRMDVLEYNADVVKDFLHRMRLQKTTERWAVTDIVNDTYWTHMNSEVKREIYSQGRVTYGWRLRTSQIPNHLFDCEILQIVMAMFLDRITPTIDLLK